MLGLCLPSTRSLALSPLPAATIRSAPGRQETANLERLFSATSYVRRSGNGSPSGANRSATPLLQ